MDPDVAEQTTTTTAAAAANDHSTNIVKGKRTKRQRLQSSIPFTILPQLSSSPASSSDFPASSTTTEEQDTAKCLILLSKGHHNNHELISGYKFNSKRYIQTPNDTVNGFAGIYVYECKTCSRTFPSFQALGGHRASHKKPRINEDYKRKPPPYTVVSDEDEFPSRKNNSSSSSSLSLQLNTKKPFSSKIHECSICGTEFNSGQALGGHMRRHRVTTTTTTSAATNTTLSLIPYSPVTITTMVADDDQDNIHKSRNDGSCLDLDLNLPAPPEIAADHRRESSFTFTANPTKQQSTVHLSAAPTLVDCHY